MEEPQTEEMCAEELLETKEMAQVEILNSSEV
jgi:hypothetical protein